MSFVSKTKLKALKDCSLQFYLELNHPELKRFSAETQYAFRLGNNFESKIKAKFKDGVEIKEWKNTDKLAKTKEIMVKHKTLFEAAFSSNNIIILADIMDQKKDDSWKMIEVKSGSKLKKEYILDVTIQYWTAINAGINISEVEVWTVDRKNKNSIYKVNKMLELVQSGKSIYFHLIRKSEKISKMKKEPAKTMGPHCEKCPFQWRCFKDIENNPKHVYNLPDFEKKWEAITNKVDTINHPQFMEAYAEYVQNKPIVIQALHENRAIIDIKNIKPIFDKLIWPVHVIDFEGVSYDVPIFKDSRPYDPVLIEFSHEKIETDLSSVKDNFLVETKEMDYDLVAARLLQSLEGLGSIIVWENSFELTQIDRLAGKVTIDELKVELAKLRDRFIDLRYIFEYFIYSPKFMGHGSLKKIAPIVLKEDYYRHLKIKSGGVINEKFLELITEIEPNKKEALKKDLVDYCDADVKSTSGLFLWVLRKIKQLSTAR